MIYFIQEIGLFRSRVKIGFTNHIKNRVSSMQSDSPSRLRVLLVLPGDRQTEMSYHARFEKYRLHREWFRYSLALRIFIWSNQYKSFTVEPELEPELELELELELEPELEPEPTMYNEEGLEKVLGLINDGKFSWNKATQAAFGKGKFGSTYINKLKRIFEQNNIEFDIDKKRASKIKELHINGLSKQEIAEYFNYKSNSGRIYYQIKDALED